MKQKKDIIPLPFFIYYYTVLGFAVAGLADAIYLSISHYRVYMDMGYRSFCAISKAINCDTVSQSPYSIIIGMPVPLWGVFSYGFFCLLLIGAKSRVGVPKRLWTLLLILSFGFSLYSIILALISTFYVKSYCIMCIFSYGINLFLLYYTWLIRKRFKIEGLLQGVCADLRFLWQCRKKSLPIMGAALTMLTVTWIWMPPYWQLKTPSKLIQLPTGLTPDGHPWIGARHPVLEITEFTDYQCFQCRKMHYYLRQLIAENPKKIRLIHRHFPMDSRFNPIVTEPFHVGSGKLALIAIYAAMRHKFWEVNDYLFETARQKKTVNSKEIAEKTGIDESGLALAIKNAKIRYLLNRDIRAGIKLGITGTPAFLIDDKVYIGQIPPEIIEKGLE